MPKLKPVDTSSWTFDDRELTAREMELCIKISKPSPDWPMQRAELVWRRCTNDAVTLDMATGMTMSEMRKLFIERVQPMLLAGIERGSENAKLARDFEKAITGRTQ